jgi:hypothetical protein
MLRIYVASGCVWAVPGPLNVRVRATAVNATEAMLVVLLIWFPSL